MSDVTDKNFRELIIPLGHEDGERVGNEPVENTDHPELQAQSEGRRQRPIDNGHASGRPAQQYGLGQRPAHRDRKALDLVSGDH